MSNLKVQSVKWHSTKDDDQVEVLYFPYTGTYFNLTLNTSSYHYDVEQRAKQMLIVAYRKKNWRQTIHRIWNKKIVNITQHRMLMEIQNDENKFIVSFVHLSSCALVMTWMLLSSRLLWNSSEYYINYIWPTIQSYHQKNFNGGLVESAKYWHYQYMLITYQQIIKIHMSTRGYHAMQR